MKIKLVAHTPNPDLVVALAAKLCYSKVGVDDIEQKLTPEEIERFVGMLTSIGHESPLEHVTFTFAVEGISRACSHQLVRHRIASYSQQSQRYVNLVDKFEYIVPPAYKNNPILESIYLKAMKQDAENYADLVKISLLQKAKELGLGEKYARELVTADEEFKKKCPSLIDYFKYEQRKEYMKAEKQAIEDARYVFPNACETKLVFTMNARTLINFIKHRKCKRAQWELRNLAIEIEKIVAEVSPILSKALSAPCEIGPCPEGSMCCGNPYPKRGK